MYISDGVKYANISENITIYNYYIRRDCIELVTPGGIMTIYNNDDDAILIKKWINECKKSLTRDKSPSETMKNYICNYLEFRIECGDTVTAYYSDNYTTNDIISDMADYFGIDPGAVVYNSCY